MASTPICSAMLATSTATMLCSSQPAAHLDASAECARRRAPRKEFLRAACRSRSNPEPPHFTTFFAGQPRLMSTMSKPNSSTLAAARAIASGFAPKSCAVIGCSSGSKSKYRSVRPSLRVRPSALVNSVMIRPQPPKPANHAAKHRVRNARHRREDRRRADLEYREL